MSVLLGIWGKGGFKKYWKETLLLYDDLYYVKETRNTTKSLRKFPKLTDRFGVDFAGTYDGDNVTFYYLVQAFPRELFIDFKDRLRRECRPGIKIHFLNLLRGHRIDWNSAHMRSRLRVLKQISTETEESDVDAYNLHENISLLSRQDWIEESLTYLAIADRKRGRALLKSSVMMIITGTRGDNFDDTIKVVEEYAYHIGIKLERVLYEIPDLLRYFSPMSRQFSKRMVFYVPVQVLTDEIVARYSSYNQGTLGSGGIYFGTDLYSGFPVLKRVKPRDDTAENWLITAETGGGKSQLLKILLLQLLALGFRGTIMDVEGFEYIPLAYFLSHNSDVVIVNMAEGSGKYFDPVEIFDPIGIEDIDRDAKNMSINFTLAVFKTLLGKAYLEDIWLDTVVNDAVSETYKNAGVTDDPKTWGNSKGLTLFDVYNTLLSLKENKFRDDPAYLSALEKAIAITSRYFEPDGTRSSVFTERVRVSDIINADLVICSFGMAGKSQHAIDEIQLSLMQLGAAQLSHQRSIFSKSQGKFNFKVWEEFQRWGRFPDSDKTIGVAVTGGRKLGDVNIILTNDVGQILRDDRFGILSNVTSYMIGAIADEKVREELCERLSIPNMKKELDLIASSRVVDDGEETKHTSPMTYAFLAGLDRNKYAILKMLIPDDLARSKIFKTGVDLKG